MSFFVAILFCILASVNAHAQAGFFDGFNGGSANTPAPQPGLGFLFGEQPMIQTKRPRIVIRSVRRRPTVPGSPKTTSFKIQSTKAMYCVRACDGFYFPIQAGKQTSGIEGQTKVCNALCPGSATLLYSPRGGNDIESSVDTKGVSYSKLTNALRFRKEVVPSCSCKSQVSDGLGNLPITEDLTLKKGDMVVSKGGVRIFKGSGRYPYQDADFSKPQDVEQIRRN